MKSFHGTKNLNSAINLKITAPKENSGLEDGARSLSGKPETNLTRNQFFKIKESLWKVECTVYGFLVMVDGPLVPGPACKEIVDCSRTTLPPPPPHPILPLPPVNLRSTVLIFFVCKPPPHPHGLGLSAINETVCASPLPNITFRPTLEERGDDYFFFCKTVSSFRPAVRLCCNLWMHVDFHTANHNNKITDVSVFGNDLCFRLMYKHVIMQTGFLKNYWHLTSRWTFALFVAKREVSTIV